MSSPFLNKEVKRIRGSDRRTVARHTSRGRNQDWSTRLGYRRRALLGPGKYGKEGSFGAATALGLLDPQDEVVYITFQIETPGIIIFDGEQRKVHIRICIPYYVKLKKAEERRDWEPMPLFNS